jgi:methionyl-tRNA formyltransferase
MNVVLFALTGFGNPVLEALLAHPRVRVPGVFTQRYDGPFPYYEERQLVDLCAERAVPCYPDVKVGESEGLVRLRALAPEVILVATFKQMLTAPVLAAATRGVVNLHPSLLPRHRGPCPTHAALRCGDVTTGVTAHHVTPGVDDGDILLQRQVPISELDDDGALRRRLATLAGAMVPDLLDLWESAAAPSGQPQDASRATYAARPRPEDGYLERLPTAAAIARAVRALTPWPGASIAVGGDRVPVERCRLLPDAGALAGRPAGAIAISRADGIALLFPSARLANTDTVEGTAPDRGFA